MEFFGAVQSTSIMEIFQILGNRGVSFLHEGFPLDST